MSDRPAQEPRPPDTDTALRIADVLWSALHERLEPERRIGYGRLYEQMYSWMLDRAIPVGAKSGWAWCEEITRVPTGRPEPCSLRLTREGPHQFIEPGDCTGRHSPFVVCYRCDDGMRSAGDGE